MKTLKVPILGNGNYVLLEKVGGGLSSTVYRGQSTNDPTRIVAIKVIDRRELLKVSVHAEEYIQREIAIMRQLDHPNIVKLLEVLDDEKTISLVMEFCQGGSLREYLDKKGKLPEAEVFVFVSQLVDALKYMYSKSIIHRDLKPHNILLTGDGTLKICDYGFARIYEKQKLMNSILGSPLYMAPEILGSNKYTAKCDLWSLGIILHEMLAGTVPFCTNSVIQLFSFYAKESGLKLPPLIQKSVSNACNSLVESLLTVRPEDRITWPDFFQHPFFLSVVPEIMSVPSSPVSTRVESGDSVLCVLAVPRCERVDLNLSELDDTCPVRLLKLSLATKLQLDASSISASCPPMLVVCSSSGVTEMEDDKPLAMYSSLFAHSKTEKPRILYIDIANLHDYAGEALCDNSVDQKEDVKCMIEQDSTDIGRLVKDFEQFVSCQNSFYKIAGERFGRCIRYLADRDILLSTVRKALLLLESTSKSLGTLSGASIELYNHQQHIIVAKSCKFTSHLQDMRVVALHPLLKADGRVTLLDLAGGETALRSLLDQITAESERLGTLVKAIKTVSAKADLEIQTPLSCEDTLKSLRGTQREVQQWVEGLRLYRDHTAKWASVVAQHKAERESDSNNSDDIGALEWSFVVDGLLEVRAGCVHDLTVAEKLIPRVQAYQQKCTSTSASMWEELSSRLKSAVDVRRALRHEVYALGTLGKQILNQQARVDMLEAIFYLPKLYQAFIHTLYGRFTFENCAMDMLGKFSALRERQVAKLTSFQDSIKGSPFEHIFKQAGELSISALPNLQPTEFLIYHNVPSTESIDDEFSVVVPEEDVMTFVCENAILAAEVKQLKEEKQAQDIKIPVVQVLGLTAETEQLRKDLEDSREDNAKQANELTDLRAKYNELANTMKDRETEKSRERDEFSIKYAHSIEVLRTQNKVQQSQYETKILELQKELEQSKAAAPPGEDNTKIEHRDRDEEELYVVLAEKQEALVSLQAALDVSEAERVEQSTRIEILLKLLHKQD